FGGTFGVITFNPDRFYIESDPSKVVLNALSIFNEPVRFQNSTDSVSILRTPLDMCKELTFSHDQNMITFGFATLDLTAPKNNRFKYMLEGFSTDWIEADRSNKATFT